MRLSFSVVSKKIEMPVFGSRNDVGDTVCAPVKDRRTSRMSGEPHIAYVPLILQMHHTAGCTEIPEPCDIAAVNKQISQAVAIPVNKTDFPSSRLAPALSLRSPSEASVTPFLLSYTLQLVPMKILLPGIRPKVPSSFLNLS